ncbi:GNAT family N-acetyltransferase [Aurantiacibacter odishensis]|uniref:GNAT family N-acetyltransferase n=1 Tax=Aurantiacibacter odishensis TaxID=1155476 RepID=UPI000E70BC6D|nr:GNAT family N-acetyltransferase [Aurantiacibacter odishensis]
MRPFLALARSHEQGIALPLCRTGNGFEALTNWYAFTWSDLRTSGAGDDAMLRELAADLARRTHRVVLSKLPDDGTLTRFAHAFRSAGWLVIVEPCDTNHVLAVGERSYEQYLASRPGHLRTTLKRKAKKVELAIADRFDPADWSAYEDIYADSWKPEEGDPDLLRAFAQGESEAGRYRFALARRYGQPIAAQFWTVDNGTAYIHKLAHRQGVDKLSPGTTLTAAMFERVIDTDGVNLVDFGTGDDPYKRDWMEDVRVRWRLICLGPGSPRNWPVLAKHVFRKLVRGASDG